MKKTIIKFMLCIIVFVFAFTIFNDICINNEAFAEEINDINAILEEMTSSDIVDTTNNTEIVDIVSQIKSHPEMQNNITQEISKIVPLQLMVTDGIHIYMGKEYGIVVVTNTYSSIGYSSLLVIDFESYKATDSTSQNNEIVENKIRYRITPILDIYCIVTNNNGTITVSWLRDSTSTFALYNFSMSATLYNEDEANQHDQFYNQQHDNGDIISRAATKFNLVNSPYYDLSNPISDMIFDVAMIALGAYDDYHLLEFTQIGLNYFDNIIGDDSKHMFEPKYIGLMQNDQCVDWNAKPKDEQLADGKKYSRNVFFRTPEEKEFLAYAKVSKQSNVNDCYVEFEIDTQGCESNSRIEISTCFNIFFYDGNQEYLIGINEEGIYELLSTDYVSIEGANILSNTKTKVLMKSPNALTDSHQPVYLLDKDGYHIFEFIPKKEDSLYDIVEYVFGNYKFNISNANQIIPAVKMYLFEKGFGDNEIDWRTLCKLPKEDLSTHSNLVAQLDSRDNYSLNYEFENDLTTNNNYYVMFTYAFDYIGGSTLFNASYDFMPDALTLGQSINYGVNANGEVYYMFTSPATNNYTVSITGATNLQIYVYDYQVLDINNSEYYSGNTVDVLMRYGERYYIKIKNNSTDNVNGTIQVTNGLTMVDGSINTQMQILQKKYYKILTGLDPDLYEITVSSTNENMDVSNVNYELYDANFNEVNLQEPILLYGNSTYYVQLYNNNTVDASVLFSLDSISDEAVFQSSFQIATNGDKKYYAYVVEWSKVDAQDLDAIISIDGVSVSLPYVFENRRLTVDLTNASFNVNSSIGAQLIISYYSNDIEMSLSKSVPVLLFDMQTLTTSATDFSAEKIYLSVGNETLSDKIINISPTVKMIFINSTTNVALVRNISFVISDATEPLVIYANDMAGKQMIMYAAINRTAITSYRDIIFNVKGYLGFRGGDGIDNGFYTELDGNPALVTDSSKTVYTNGTGSIHFIGGNGGDTYISSSNPSFYNNDPAGSGGTGAEVGNMIICIETTMQGGKGGNGGVGATGANGANGVGYKATNTGADGEAGGVGGYGGDGGMAGMGLVVLGTKCAVYHAEFEVNPGQAGNGGRGGTGGTGGNGADGFGDGWFTFGPGGNGGNGGQGGQGGDAGQGMIAVNEADIRKMYNYSTMDNTTFNTMISRWSANGIAGYGGYGGAGGTGGFGGRGLFGSGQIGYDGSTGASGSSGSV